MSTWEKTFLLWGQSKTKAGLPREVVYSPILEIFKEWLDASKAISSSNSTWEVEDMVILGGLFQTSKIL